MDLGTVVPCCSGPKRPQDRVAVTDMKRDFEGCLGAKVTFSSKVLPSCVMWEVNHGSRWGDEVIQMLERLFQTKACQDL